MTAIMTARRLMRESGREHPPADLSSRDPIARQPEGLPGVGVFPQSDIPAETSPVARARQNLRDPALALAPIPIACRFRASITPPANN